MPPILLLVILLVVVVIAIVGYVNSDAYKIRKALKESVRVAIPDAPMGTVVEVAGSVRPIGNWTLYGPLTGRPCVYHEAIVEEYRSSGKSGRWVEIIRDIAAVDFLIEDGSGRAHVSGSPPPTDWGPAPPRSTNRLVAPVYWAI